MSAMHGGHRTLLPAALLLCGCLSYRPVTLEGIDRVRTTRLDKEGIALRLDVRVANPNRYRLKVRDPDVDLFLDGVFVGKGHLDSMLVLQPRVTRTYSVPMHAELDQGGLPAALLGLSGLLKGYADLRVQGTVVGQAGLLRRRFPFELEQRLDQGHH